MRLLGVGSRHSGGVMDQRDAKVATIPWRADQQSSKGHSWDGAVPIGSQRMTVGRTHSCDFSSRTILDE